ncbi:MAG: electron transfer flavoprotein subunit alpha/FixB family protein [Bacteroidales bacterium]|jgi:electron transfer flavoprotein alpha subunit|nr:electron transfer flavoprotein subunit alpha/FixB family protein [Bacteroidales bacterium]
MNNIIVYAETDSGKICDVSLELLTKARGLAERLGVDVEALLIGSNVEKLAPQLYEYGAKVVHLADDPCLEYFRTLPYAAITLRVFNTEKPQIALFGATTVGRDLAPRVSSALKSGLTADCTSLEIGDHDDAKTGKHYTDLLYQIRPAFGGNIIATIVNPEHRPQMATVREGVMKKEPLSTPVAGKIKRVDVATVLVDSDFAVEIIKREIEERKIDIKGAQIIVDGGYGVGSKENFSLIFDLAKTLGAQVGASRAAVDAGFVENARQIGQTGVTVRPKLIICVGVSGAIQHTAGMDQSKIIIAINNDPQAPIHKIADYSIIGDLNEVVPKMIASYKKQSK